VETSDTARSTLSIEHGGQRAGRPYDHSSNERILSSTLDLLAEGGFEAVTLDAVAARAGKAKTTLYRRWATKEELILGAIRAAGHPPEVDDLPDLGSLRSDLLAVVDSPWLGGPDRRLSIFAGLASAMRTSEQLAVAVRTEVTEPYSEIYRRLLHRAIDRGEVAAKFAASVAVLAEVIPAMSTHRLNAGQSPVQRDFFISVVDDVVLAALQARGTDQLG
jgi:AcrR family transcriptional regulator